MANKNNFRINSRNFITHGNYIKKDEYVAFVEFYLYSYIL